MPSLVNPKSTVEAAGLSWLQATLVGIPDFASVNFYRGQTSAEKKLPCVVASCPRADEHYPGTGIYRAELSFHIVTSIDEKAPASEGAPAGHCGRVDWLTNKLQDTGAFLSYMGTTGRLQAFGMADLTSTSQPVARHFEEIITFSFFVRAG